MERFLCITLCACAILFPLALYGDFLVEDEPTPAYAIFMGLAYASVVVGLCTSVIRDRWNR